MGKYMRKCRGAGGEEVAGVEVTQVVGVRTRSRSAAAPAPAPAGGVAKVVAPKRKKAVTPPNVVAAGEPAGADGDGGSCYIKLRSRTLFMAPPQPQPSAPRAPVPEQAVGGAGQGAALVAGLSRCSSTASSVDVGCQDRNLLACRSEAAEAGGDHILEISTSNSGNDPGRERRETTPSSRAQGEVVSDLESDLAGQKASPATTSAPQLMTTPPEDEIREFFAAAEKEQAERFAAKYNFDILRDVPIDGGRFEWTPVVSI